jgi:CRISPR-associated protein Cas2
MYVLIVYDIEVARVVKVHKFLKRHLHWVQNSVFEGELTDAQIETIKAGLGRLLKDEADSVLIYTARDQRWLKRETMGRQRSEISNVV